MAQVFISYSSKELSQAQAVRSVLEQNGISCWMAPGDIPGGSNYTREIPLAIRACQAFVLILSSNAQASQWVLKELDTAVSNCKIILPFQLEDISLTDEFNFLLTGAQRYDAYQKKAEATKNLVQRIKAIIEADESCPAEEEATAKEEIPVEEARPVREEKPQQVVRGLCPACGSSKIKDFGDAVRPHLPGEYLLCTVFSVIFAALLFVGALIVGLVMSMMVNQSVMTLLAVITILLALAGAVFGVILGNRIARKKIRIKRLQSRTAVTEHQCQTCRKRFQLPLTDIK